MASTFTATEHRVFERFTSYPFDSDAVFEQGRSAVVERAKRRWEEERKAKDAPLEEEEVGKEGGEDGSDMKPEGLRKLVQAEVLGSKVFYFSKVFNTKVDLSRYTLWLSSKAAGTLASPILDLPSSSPLDASAPATSTPGTVSTSAVTPEETFRSFERFSFDSDPRFQEGVKVVLEKYKHADPAERDRKLEEVRAWYYGRYIQPMSHAEYRRWKDGTLDSAPVPTPLPQPHAPLPTAPSGPPTSSSLWGPPDAPAREPTPDADGQPRYPRSFAELCQLVAEGKPIPGVKQIPNTLAGGEPSKPAVAPRKKPWEK